MVKRIVRVASPAMLALALVVFLLPFLAVSCDTPGGFGRAAHGGTTSYSGFDLAAGSAPSVEEDHLRPVGARDDDTVGVQLAVLVALVALVAALILTLLARHRRSLRMAVGAVAGVALVIGVLVARAALVDKVETQADRPFPQGKTASDYVLIGAGFWGALVLIVVAIGCGALEGWSEKRGDGDA